MKSARLVAVAVMAALGITGATASARGGDTQWRLWGAWSPAEKIDEIDGNSAEINTVQLDGCPIQSPDGLSLYLASNRPRFAGDTRTDLDIWVAQRPHRRAPWGPPVNVGAPVNSTADDFCPTPVRRRGLFFVSRLASPGSCGQGDIYFTRFSKRTGWQRPKNLGCDSQGGPNTAADEMGPSYINVATGKFLFFSSGPDLFVSKQHRGRFGLGRPLVELNSPDVDIQPNVRKDGLEIVFSSNRIEPSTHGGQDIWLSRRHRVSDPWSAPMNLGGATNTSANETRPSLSRDARTLLFGRSPGPEGASDIFVSTRRPWCSSGCCDRRLSGDARHAAVLAAIADYALAHGLVGASPVSMHSVDR